MIPKMIDKRGKHWEQPKTKNILVDDTTAMMTLDDFNLLHEYNFSVPSGVYAGKMWKCAIGNTGKYMLRWFSDCVDEDDEGFCYTHSREIVIV